MQAGYAGLHMDMAGCTGLQAGHVWLQQQSSASRRWERWRDTPPPSGWGWERGEEGEAVRMTHARPSAVSSSATWLGSGLGLGLWFGFG